MTGYALQAIVAAIEQIVAQRNGIARAAAEFCFNGGNHARRKIQISYRRIDDLVLDPSNPRQHAPKQIKQLAAAIQEFGFLVPVVVDGSGRVVAGHARVLAAKSLGLAEVPVVELRHLLSSQLKAFRLTDNKLALNASWDHHRLAQELTALRSVELHFPVALTGFSLPEIDCIIRKKDRVPIAERTGGATRDVVVSRRGEHRASTPVTGPNAIYKVATGSHTDIAAVLGQILFEFIDENGGGPGVRLRKPTKQKPKIGGADCLVDYNLAPSRSTGFSTLPLAFLGKGIVRSVMSSGTL
jgi:ParB/Sulfiredoxin domain